MTVAAVLAGKRICAYAFLISKDDFGNFLLAEALLDLPYLPYHRLALI